MRPTACVVFILAAYTPFIAAAQDMPLSDVLIAGQGWEVAAEGFQFSDAPAVDGDGNMYVTDVRASKIYRLSADGAKTVFVDDCKQASGLFFGQDGRLYACQRTTRQIVAYDAAGNETVIAGDILPNDITVDDRGGVYVTEPTEKRVWYVASDGSKRIVDTGIERANGLILWPDRATLVVSDSAGPYLWTFRVEDDGSLRFKQPYYTLDVPRGAAASAGDGMTVDTAGRVYVTSAAGLQVFDPTGRLSGVILKPQPGPLTNVALGGPAFDTLYVSSGDKVFRRKTKAAGVGAGG